MLSDLRKPQVLKRIGALLAIGMGPNEIKDAVKEEFGIDTSAKVIDKVIKTYAVRREEITTQDQKYSDLYKEILMDLIEKVKGNLKTVDELKELVLSRLKVYKDAEQDKGMLIYIKEINSAVRTFNDSIKTMNELLKRLEVETKETKVSTVKAVQLSMDALKELERDGRITINRDIYKDTKEVIEDEGEGTNGEGTEEETVEFR